MQQACQRISLDLLRRLRVSRTAAVRAHEATTSNIYTEPLQISRQQRANQKSQQPCILWFTGLSGAGKSTIANAVEQELFRRGYHSYLLDGDYVRSNESSFSHQVRSRVRKAALTDAFQATVRL